MKLAVFLPVVIALVERVVAVAVVWGTATGGQVGIFSDKACTNLVQVSIVGGANQVFTPAASTTCTAGSGTWANFYLQKITASSSTSTSEGSLVTVPFWNSYDGYANILTYTDSGTSGCQTPAQNIAAAMGGQVPFKAGTCTVLSVPVGEVKALKFVSTTGLTLWATTDCTTTQVGALVAAGSNVATSALTQALLPAAATSANCLSVASSPTWGYIALVGKPMVQGPVTLYGYYSDSGCSSLVDYWLIGTPLSTAAAATCSTSGAPYYKFPVSSSASAVTEASAFTTTQFDTASLYDGYAVIMSYGAAACPSASVATGSGTAAAGVVAPFKAGGACVSLSGTSSTIALGGASYKYTTSGGFILYSDNACATALAPFTSAVFVLGQPAMCLNNAASGASASYWVNLVRSGWGLTTQ
ncbi:hypothetical protein BCR33DRAFT_733355, partial [Rhizoclosmatium globosum]